MDKPKYLLDGDRWILAEEIPDIDFQFSQIWLSSFVNNLEKSLGINYKKVLCVYNGYNLKFYYGDKDSEAVSKKILDRIVTENFGKVINKNIRKEADKLRKITDSLTPEYLAKLNNKKFSELYAKLDSIHSDFYAWCWLPNAVDMFHSHFTNHLRDILLRHTQKDEEVNAALVALSFSAEKSFIQEEAESLLKLALFRKQNPKDQKKFEEMLKKHFDEYFYLKHLWIGKEGVTTMEEYRSAVEKILSEQDPKAALLHEGKKWNDDKKLRGEYEKKLKLPKQEKALFREYAEFAFTKTYRRQVQLYWAYKMDFIFEELSQRLGISFMEARFLTPNEVYAALEHGLSEKMKLVLKERARHCVYYGQKDLEIVTVGAECKQFEKTIIEEKQAQVAEVKGQVACVGKVRGIVKIVNSPSDISKVNAGDILVSIATNPDVLPAMKKAIAFVTEQGGITSHAAIVAREMKKPCVIGTKIATKVFKDGDMVEVDAEKGIVRKLT